MKHQVNIEPIDNADPEKCVKLTKEMLVSSNQDPNRVPRKVKDVMEEYFHLPQYRRTWYGKLKCYWWWIKRWVRG